MIIDTDSFDTEPVGDLIGVGNRFEHSLAVKHGVVGSSCHSMVSGGQFGIGNSIVSMNCNHLYRGLQYLEFSCLSISNVETRALRMSQNISQSVVGSSFQLIDLLV
jgi:hypothetical protein